MDISTASSLIYDWFSEKDSFSLKNNYKQLNWAAFGDEKLDEDECQAAVQAAIADMVKNNFITPVELGAGKGKDAIYVINNSIKNQPISIDLSRKTSENVATVVTNLLPFLTLEKVAPINPRHLDESHIVLLLEAISLLGGQVQENIAEKEKQEELKKKESKPKDKENPPESES